MNFTKFGLITIVSALMIFISSCATNTEPSESYKNETANQIFNKAEIALKKKNYSDAIKRYEALSIQYPYDKNAETVDLHIIYAYYQNSDYLEAEAAADRFIRVHPTSPYVDYAYFMRGISNYYQNLGLFERFFNVDYATRDLAQVKKSFNDFATLTQRFPQSRYVPAAHQYMVYLRNILANHELEVAQFYYDKAAYVAAVNRANSVVLNYQGTPAVPKALVLMAKSYQKLQMNDSAKQVLEVIQLNYPNSSYLAEAQKL